MPDLTSTVEAVPEEQSANSEATRPPRVGFVSLGCPKNLVDSEVMMGMLAQAGAVARTRQQA